MKTLFKVPILVAVLATFAAAADKPDFSGAWKLDPDKSNFGPMPAPDKMERKVSHKDPSLSVDESRSGAQGDMAMSFKYTTDGKESTNSFMGQDMKSTAAWDGSALVINSKADFGGAEVKITSKWSLSADGKVLTDAWHIVSPQGEVDLVFVMNKQ